MAYNPLEEDYKVIHDALGAAERFTDVGNAWLRKYSAERLDSYRSRERAAVLRASLDLTYALAKLRQGRKR
jgi:hypothetical protein